MTAIAGRFVVSLALIVTAAPVAVAQQAEVKWATATLVRKPATSITVYVENLRDSPIDAYEITLFAPSDATRPLTAQTWEAQIPGVIRPIQPHETRAIDFPVRGRSEPAVARMTMVAFEDGYAEGSTRALDALSKKQQQRAEDLAWWLRVFDSMPRSSDAEAKEYLLENAIERAPLDDPTALRMNLRTMLNADGRPGWLLALIDNQYRPRAEVLLAWAKRFLARAVAPDVSGVVKAVNVRSAPASGTEIVLRIENLADVPIVAWQVDFYDLLTRGWSESLARELGGPPGSIQPHEVREEPYGRRLAESDQLPPARLSFVLFEDLTCEGSPMVRDRKVREREQRAGDLAYCVQVLKDAAGMPVEAAESFIEARVRDRAREANAANRSFSSGLLQDVIDQAQRHPERFASYVEMRQKTLEEQRQSLLRPIKAK